MIRSRLPLFAANRWTITLVFCSSLTAFAAMVPVVRAWFRMEVLTNEGWNLYFAIAAAGGRQLYPQKYGWTTDNYPILSFELFACLHRFTHDYLFTARAVSLLSLLAISVLVGLIVLRISSDRRAALLAALFCIAIFCANTDPYVGADEPQLLAHAFFTGGLYLAIAADGAAWALVAAALLFAIGGSVKYNLIDVPIAVLIATALQSVRRAALFAVSGLGFAAVAVWLNLHFGGPHFLDEVLLPRDYSWLKGAEQTGIVLGPILIPLLVAARMAWALLPDARGRVLAIELMVALLLGFYFSGGSGVAMNAQFSVQIVMSMLIGLAIAEVEAGRTPWNRPAAAWLPLAMFAWLIVPLLVSGDWNIVGNLRATRAAQSRFSRHVAFLRGVAGPAICESSLLCASAGQPFLYDPFNATRLIEYGKLNQQPMLDALREHRIAAVALDAPVGDEDFHRDRLSPAMRLAIQQYYVPALQDEDATIYLPRTPDGRKPGAP